MHASVDFAMNLPPSTLDQMHTDVKEGVRACVEKRPMGWKS
jgi:hypothetical protein